MVLFIALLVVVGWMLSTIKAEDDDSFCPMAALAGKWELKDDTRHEYFIFEWNKDKKYLEMTIEILVGPQNRSPSRGLVCYDAKTEKLYLFMYSDDGKFHIGREVKRLGKDVYLELTLFNNPNGDKLYVCYSFSENLFVVKASLELDNWVDLGSIELRRIE